MAFLTFSFSLVEWVLLGILLLAFAIQLYFYFRYMQGVLRQARKVRKGKVTFNREQPGVSVIVCARDEAINLHNYLPTLLNQDYPAYEVIVINDASMDDTQEILNSYAPLYPNLRLTFVPLGVRIRSPKKLGLTLGIKAAKYDYLLFTDADCRPESRHWIAEMMRGFTPQTEIVLGHGAYFEEKSFLNRLITYDTLFVALQYMGMAAVHKPYMGVGRNLAYRKSTFFDNDGFAGLLGLLSGDDDLFVNKVANNHNTNVVVAPDALTWSVPKKYWCQWFAQKKRHLLVSPYYSAHSKMQLCYEPVTRGIFYLCLVLAGILGTPLVWLVAGVLFLVRLLVQLLVINHSARHFGERKYGLSLLLFDILLPLVNLYILTIGRLFKSRQQSW